MSPPKGTLWIERCLVLLILASLAGTLHLIVTIHRQALRARPVEKPAPRTASIPVVPPAPPSPPKIATKPKPARPPDRAPVAEDPTKKALAELSAAAAGEIQAAREADSRTQALEKARLTAVAESQRWRRRELLVEQQVAALADQARTIDRQIDTLADQRDVLARERDALKTTVAKSRQGEGSYAVLPYKGPNGTWRRPIVLECSNGSVTLRPSGPTFSMLDLSAMINPRSSPVIVAIARELLRIQNSESPDGSPVAPYFVFLVRPDGIRPYYELRARLEPLRIAFGYELIEQDLKVDVPDFDNLATWDGTIPLEEPLLSAPGRQGGAGAGGDESGGLSWPGAAPGPEHTGREGLAGGGPGGRPDRHPAGTAAGDDADSPDAFIWPSGRGTRGSSGGIASVRRPAGGPSARAGAGQGQGDRISLPLGSPRGSDRGRGAGGLNFALEPAGPGQGGAGQGGGAGGLPELEPAGGSGGGAGGIAASAAEPSPAGDRGGGAGTPDPREADLPSNLLPLGEGAAQRRMRATSPPATASLEPSSGLRPDPASQVPPAPSGRRDQQTPRRLLADSSLRGNQDVQTPRLSGSNESPRAVDAEKEPAVGGGSGSEAGLDLDTALQAGTARSAPDSASSGSTSGRPAGAVGLSLGSLSNPSRGITSGGSGLVLGSDAIPGAKPDSSNGAPAGPRFGSRIPDGPTRTIDVPFEIVVVCQPEGLVIHPGGYLITKTSLDRNRKDGVLVKELLAVARQRAAADPTIRPQPRVKFLIEGGGSTTFWMARKQILFSNLGWPMSLQVTGEQVRRPLDQETW
jgi:hypothetical protein